MRSSEASAFDDLHANMPGRGVSGAPPEVPNRAPRPARPGAWQPVDAPPFAGQLVGEAGRQEPLEQLSDGSSAPRQRAPAPRRAPPESPRWGALHDKPWDGRTGSGRGAGSGTPHGNVPPMVQMGGSHAEKAAGESPTLRRAIPLPFLLYYSQA